MKQTIKLNERELKQLIRESVKNVLNENGWEQDPMEWPVVNTSQDGSDIYKVGLWWGSGYWLDIYLAWADSDEEALYNVVAYLTKNKPELIENAGKAAEETAQDIMRENGCSREEAEEYPGFYESFMYVDATSEGATHACYIWSENLTIMEAPEEWKQKFLEREHQQTQSDNDELNESAKKHLNESTESYNIRNWVYWCFNFTEPEKWIGIFEGAPAEHFMKKLQQYFNQYGTVEGMCRFFVNLDKNNQEIFANYVTLNYNA